MNESQESDASLYKAPEASLEPEEENSVISAKAMRYLVSSKWWMIMASVALMLNGVLLLAGVLFLLVKMQTVSPTRKLGMGLVVVTAHLIFLPGLRLMQSALSLGRLRENREEREMVYALHRHEEFWKLLGIAFLLMGGLVFYGLLFALR